MNAVQIQCKSCGRSILWLKHERTGKVAPIDQMATAEGNILIDEERGTYRILTTHTERAEYIGRLHMPHFATCPFAARHKRK